jgi:hypothetical protein
LGASSSARGRFDFVAAVVPKQHVGSLAEEAIERQGFATLPSQAALQIVQLIELLIGQG